MYHITKAVYTINTVDSKSSKNSLKMFNIGFPGKNNNTQSCYSYE